MARVEAFQCVDILKTNATTNISVGFFDIAQEVAMNQTEAFDNTGASVWCTNGALFDWSNGWVGYQLNKYLLKGDSYTVVCATSISCSPLCKDDNNFRSVLNSSPTCESQT